VNTPESTLSDIVARLRQGRYPNEQSISQGIVLRLLQELGWDIYDPTAVWPEYQTGEGRADFALCHPPTKPAEFIEVKAPGKAEDAVRQALEYAFHTGVPFIVLTDGRTWSFYLPAEQGSYEDRRVYKLDLYERPPSEAADILRRYLAHERVASGEALHDTSVCITRLTTSTSPLEFTESSVCCVTACNTWKSLRVAISTKTLR
jgi:predicted type IV restriction endonuclease